MTSNNKEMSFWEHLEEFRWTVLRTLIVLCIFTVLGFVFMDTLYDKVIMAPTNSSFILYDILCRFTSFVPFIPDFCDSNFYVEIININLASQFFRHLSTSFWLALILSFPYLIYETWRFINPALYAHEKSKIRKAICFGTLMFFVGCTVGYLIVFPVTFRFLATYQLSPEIRNFISLDSYMDNFLMIIFIMGVVFELPLIAWLLSQFNLLNRSFFKRFRRHAVLVLLIVAAFITPSGDPFTLGIVFCPLYLLFELSYYLVKPEAIKENNIAIIND